MSTHAENMLTALPRYQDLTAATVTVAALRKYCWAIACVLRLLGLPPYSFQFYFDAFAHACPCVRVRVID